MSGKGLLIVGYCYLGPKDGSGNSTGLIGPLNQVKCEITQQSPVEMPRISHRNGPVGETLDTVYVGKPPEITIATDDASSAVLDLLFGSTPAAIMEVSAAVSDEPVSLIRDRWVKLAHRNISATSINVSTVSSPGTPLSMGADYQIDLANGLIMALTTGAAVDCLVDYSSFAVAGTRHNAARRAATKCEIIMSGTNMVDNMPCRLVVDEAVLYRDGAWDAASGDFVTITLKGNINTLPGHEEPYHYEELMLSTS